MMCILMRNGKKVPTILKELRPGQRIQAEAGHKKKEGVSKAGNGGRSALLLMMEEGTGERRKEKARLKQ